MAKVRLWGIRILLMILIGMWMSVIFGFSADNGEESQSVSDEITIKVVQVVEPDYENLSVENQETIFNQVSYAVRKTGHFTEHGILGMLIVCLLLTFTRLRQAAHAMWCMFAIAGGICLIYAASDEIHQIFVPGRDARVRDVLIDMAGACTGIAATLLIWGLIRRHLIKRAQRAQQSMIS